MAVTADHPVIMSGIAMSSLVARAAAPSICAFVVDRVGIDGALAVSLTTAGLNVLLAAGLFVMGAHSGRAQ